MHLPLSTSISLLAPVSSKGLSEAESGFVKRLVVDYHILMHKYAPPSPINDIFPLAYGHEKEEGLMDDFFAPGQFIEPYDMCNHLEQYVSPEHIKFVGAVSTMFMANGFKLYIGGVQGGGKTNVEVATPECRTLDRLVLATRAGEQLVLQTVENYLQYTSAHKGRPVKGRFQGRVVDGHGSRKASHDNFAIPEGSPVAEVGMTGQLLQHIAASSILDGAGHVTGRGLRFSQKINGLTELTKYDYVGSVYRTTDTHGTPRLEIRCKDYNISDWATFMRFGSTALAIAINQTELRDELASLDAKEMIAAAIFTNRCPLNKDGTLRNNPAQRAAADFLQKTAELAMSKLYLYVEDVPEDLQKVASELYAYSEDFKKVLSGDATIELLADRADWAAKFNLIIKGIDKDQSHGQKRSLFDIKSRFTDMYYDYIGLGAENGTLTPRVYGSGYRLRQRGKFRGHTHTDQQALQSLKRPPRGTRAAVRGRLIGKYQVQSVNWDEIELRDENRVETFRLHSVLETDIADEDKTALNRLKPIR